MDCKQAEVKIALYMENPQSLVEQRHRAFEKHLENCLKCLKKYQESKYDLVKQHWDISEDMLEFIEKSGQSYKPKMTAEEDWKDLCRRCPGLTENKEKPRSFQLFLGIGAVAACLVIGILIWMVFSNYSKTQTFSQESSSQQVASAAKLSVKLSNYNCSKIGVLTSQINLES